jgi:transcriptional regulator with XRE-family HTH domain
MPESFGARLRQHREEQAIPLITIAEQTKIKFSLLEALERDDVSHWPSGIFRRAFIRAYAHAIGLDPDVVVREFLEVHPEPAEVTAAALAAAVSADGPRTNGAPPTRLRNLVGSAFESLSRRRRAVVDDPPVAAEPRVTASAPVEPRFDAIVAHPPLQFGPAAKTDAAVAAPPARVPAPPEPDLGAVAHLCTEFGRVQTADDVQPLLEEAANILEATGLIVWIWDATAAELRPALVHGYSDRVLAQLPPVGRDADNATAAAFRSATARVIEGSDRTSGALVLPLLTAAGCAGVLAVELQSGRRSMQPARAVATIFAALLAQLIGDRVEDAPRQAATMDSAIDSFAGSPFRLTPAVR